MTEPVRTSPRRAAVRWAAAVEVLAEVRRQPGVTRAELARRLALTSGSTTEVCGRLRELQLLSERPATRIGRGRPTTTLHPHPAGALVAVVDVQHEHVTAAVVDTTGQLLGRQTHRPVQRSAPEVLGVLRQLLTATSREHGHRVRAVSLSVAGTVAKGRVVQASTLGWDGVDVAASVPPALSGLPLLVTNDATAAGLAEARTPAARAARAVLYLTVAVGIGGALVVAGRPQDGAHGAGGELGHLPFGDGSQSCPCGARGCWDLEVDGRAMARHRGQPPPADPYTYAEQTLLSLSDRTRPDRGTGEAVTRCAQALGSGIAGLVNALDVDHVVLGGLAPSLRDAAEPSFTTALTGGLMRWRREHSPTITDAVHGADASVLGAAEIGLDHLLTETGLSTWAAQQNGTPR